MDIDDMGEIAAKYEVSSFTENSCGVNDGCNFLG